MMASSSGWLPFFLPTCIMPGIWCVLPSRMRFAIGVSTTSTSSAATRPGLSMRRKRFCATTPLSDSERTARIWFCWLAGKTSMMRSIVFGALGVCSVPKTRWPVAAAVSASSIVSKIAHFADENDVRIFAQRAAQRGGEGLRVHADFAVIDQRLLAAMHKLDRILDRDDVILAMQIRVIDHRRERGRFAGAGRAGHEHEPFFSIANFFSTGGRPSSSAVSTLLGMSRKTAAMPFFWLKKFARKRAKPGYS